MSVPTGEKVQRGLLSSIWGIAVNAEHTPSVSVFQMTEKEAKGRKENWGKGGTGRTEKEKGRRGQDEEKM